eukprot:2786800-Rhodomonas_salina.2
MGRGVLVHSDCSGGLVLAIDNVTRTLRGCDTIQVKVLVREADSQRPEVPFSDGLRVAHVLDNLSDIQNGRVRSVGTDSFRHCIVHDQRSGSVNRCGVVVVQLLRMEP